MESKTNKIIEYFKSHGGVARFSSIRKAGFHPDMIKKIENEKKVEKIGKGLYRLVGDNLGSHPDYVIASLQASKGVICLLSALYFYSATNEIPRFVDMAILAGSRANKIKYPPVKFYRFSPDTWKTGIEQYKIEGHTIKIYSLAKTVCDCFKFRNRIGINVAREALKIAVGEKHIKPSVIMEYAKICRVDRIIKPILETML
ncbi:MAG: transcriptional regulator [Candidatus Omnitrophica bacterium]|nr:transcriptional regulator [Candidatus Omnitrophota bacterium]